MSTVRDVAERAGVSISTVSRALSTPARVSAATRDRVEAAARDLDYRPNLAARGLRAGRTSIVGLLVPDFDNPFFAAVTKGVQHRARQGGYSVFVGDSDEDATQELDLVRGLARQVDGLVLASPRAPDADLLAALDGTPAVLVNRELAGLPSVTVDNADGVRQIIEHLYALGHRQVAYADGPGGSWSGRVRRTGAVRAALDRDDLSVVRLGTFTPTYAGGFAAADLALASGATAVVAYNDLMALGVVERLRERGVSVPDDLSVTGFDDLLVATLVAPTLTTVRVPLRDLGRRAVDLLLEHLAPADETPRARVVLPVDLMVRRSTTVPGAGRPPQP
jgi:LacI family transcriptional regulator